MKIKHPLIKNYNLNLEGLVGPENSVFFRGRLTSQNEIVLPNYWKELVEERSLSVHLTPVGAPQELVVRGVQDNTVVLKHKPGIPLDCYYLVIATLQEGIIEVDSEE